MRHGRYIAKLVEPVGKRLYFRRCNYGIHCVIIWCYLVPGKGFSTLGTSLHKKGRNFVAWTLVHATPKKARWSNRAWTKVHATKLRPLFVKRCTLSPSRVSIGLLVLAECHRLRRRRCGL